MVKDGEASKNTPYLRRAKGYRNIMLPSGCRRIIKYYIRLELLIVTLIGVMTNGSNNAD